MAKVEGLQQALEQIRRLAGIAPDCRSREQRGQIQTPFGLATPVFCANCGKKSGYVFADTSYYFHLCNDCDPHGRGLDVPIVDESIVRSIGRQ